LTVGGLPPFADQLDARAQWGVARASGWFFRAKKKNGQRCARCP